MYFYAQIDELGYCVGVSCLSSEVKSPYLIKIDSLDESYIFKKYENGVWIDA